MIGPIRFYAHEDWDDFEWEIEQCIKAGMTQADAEAFVHTKPLYEVAFDFMVDPDKGEAYCVRVDLGSAGEFTAPYPNQQLTLWRTND